MQNFYKISWTDLALEELLETIEYLELYFSEREIKILAKEIERISSIISTYPLIFPETEKKEVRKAVVLKYNSLYYRIMSDEIQILSFFANRKSPEKRKFQ